MQTSPPSSFTHSGSLPWKINGKGRRSESPGSLPFRVSKTISSLWPDGNKSRGVSQASCVLFVRWCGWQVDSIGNYILVLVPIVWIIFRFDPIWASRFKQPVWVGWDRVVSSFVAHYISFVLVFLTICPSSSNIFMSTTGFHLVAGCWWPGILRHTAKQFWSHTATIAHEVNKPCESRLTSCFLGSR